MMVKLDSIISKGVVTRAQLFLNIKCNIASGLFSIRQKAILARL
jgi:hypothetical protein